jgi:hypothetical protein
VGGEPGGGAFPDLTGRAQDPIHRGFAARVDALVEQGGDTADSVPGGWWPGWIDWLAPHSGPQLNARKELGDAEFTPIEEAPGSYVQEKA